MTHRCICSIWCPHRVRKLASGIGPCYAIRMLSHPLDRAELEAIAARLATNTLTLCRRTAQGPLPRISVRTRASGKTWS
jgi:hypothetical protein